MQKNEAPVLEKAEGLSQHAAPLDHPLLSAGAVL